MAVGLAWLVVAAIVLALLWPKPPKSEFQDFPIAGTLYHWPKGTTSLPPRKGHYGRGYVRYESAELPDPTDTAYMLIYEGNYQRPLNEAGFPDLEMITSPWSKREELAFFDTSAGTVICNRKGVQVGLAFQCGLSFLYRGARWEIHFHQTQIPNTVKLHQDAIQRLEAFRSARPS